MSGVFLNRVSEKEAILQLLGVMASTPQGSWAACPSFGLRELLEDGRARPELLQKAVEQANQAFAELGIRGFRLERIVREAGSRPGEEEFLVTASV